MKLLMGQLNRICSGRSKTTLEVFFKDERLVAIMEFPVLFLGARPKNIPALYSLMNYAALELGTFYPMGGMRKITEGMQQLAMEMGVDIITNCEVNKINATHKLVRVLTQAKASLRAMLY